jgi:hypothetical protein
LTVRIKTRVSGLFQANSHGFHYIAPDANVQNKFNAQTHDSVSGIHHDAATVALLAFTGSSHHGPIPSHHLHAVFSTMGEWRCQKWIGVTFSFLQWLWPYPDLDTCCSAVWANSFPMAVFITRHIIRTFECVEKNLFGGCRDGNPFFMKSLYRPARS